MPRNHAALRYIAAFKLFKAVSLLLVGVVAFGFVDEPRLRSAADWIHALPLQSGRAILARWTGTLLHTRPQRYVLIGVVAFVYAGIFATEGVGLWMRKRWGEYLTLGVTASLIPFEIWEIVHRVSALKIAALVLNVAIVIYLWRTARADKASEKT